jgi:hypothetical protein
MERNQKEGYARERLVSLSSIALHPVAGMTVDKPFSLSPNRADSALDAISAELA